MTPRSHWRLPPVDDDEAEYLDERAAIREYQGGQAREAAETGAMLDLLRRRRQRTDAPSRE